MVVVLLMKQSLQNLEELIEKSRAKRAPNIAGLSGRAIDARPCARLHHISKTGGGKEGEMSKTEGEEEAMGSSKAKNTMESPPASSSIDGSFEGASVVGKKPKVGVSASLSLSSRSGLGIRRIVMGFIKNSEDCYSGGIGMGTEDKREKRRRGFQRQE
ncbi:monogalactosyldiacylglycerol synthase [Pyrus ussuriensis x Pyrus communis]|uniref:Monogalactosyldiacylglycerol synthase n=1 Tax=Pyrus ussuriensis x Pyrus communis TaxID=2448454 RepID=A0A5N5FNB4_9ROSA|nr:monogalactosyldiacylglycerol synthase [Pyrus ussuriensis x Pyrus communis]